jgi:hypothetical protein
MWQVQKNIHHSFGADEAPRQLPLAQQAAEARSHKIEEKACRGKKSEAREKSGSEALGGQEEGWSAPSPLALVRCMLYDVRDSLQEARSSEEVQCRS